MANVDAPFGLRPVGELGSNIQNGGTSKYLITSGDSQAIFKGDLVKLEATGYITKTDDSDAVASIGVFNGCFYQDPTTAKPTWSNYYPGSITVSIGTIDAFVYDDPNKLFEIQGNGVIAVGGLMLARIPQETVKERSAHFAQLTQDKDDAIANDPLKDQHPSMPVQNESRASRVTFGGKKPN